MTTGVRLVSCFLPGLVRFRILMSRDRLAEMSGQFAVLLLLRVPLMHKPLNMSARRGASNRLSQSILNRPPGSIGQRVTGDAVKQPTPLTTDDTVERRSDRRLVKLITSLAEQTNLLAPTTHRGRSRATRPRFAVSRKRSKTSPPNCKGDRRDSGTSVNMRAPRENRSRDQGDRIDYRAHRAVLPLDFTPSRGSQVTATQSIVGEGSAAAIARLDVR